MKWLRACRSKSLALPNAVLTSFWVAAVAIFVATGSNGRAENPHADVLAIGGTVTEIIYALGQEHRLVARDTTSTYPPEAQALPDIGYMRALSPEGVLSVEPELIISEEGAGPPEAIDVLKEAKIAFVTVPDEYTADGIVEKIRRVGDALAVPEKADALAADVRKSLEAAKSSARAAAVEPKRVMFILSTQSGRIMSAGEDTSAEAIIRMSGGVNAVTGFQGFKPLIDEAVTAAAPDVILMMDRGGSHGAQNDELFAMPALRTTPAADSEAVVRIDGLLLLGFGPRTAQAVSELSAALYGG